MKAELINPFISATVTTFDTMCGVSPKRNGQLGLKIGTIDTDEIVAVIGLTGIRGAVLMATSFETGGKMVAAFLGDEAENQTELMDAFGELLNILAGAAAAKLNGYNIEIGLPTVLAGQRPTLNANELMPWVTIPMSFGDWGEFNIYVSMEDPK